MLEALSSVQHLLVFMKTFNPDQQRYEHARTGTVFTRLGRGILRGRGADRLDLLHRLSTNSTRELRPGEETTTILTSDKGRIIEVLRVIALDDAVLLMTLGPDAEQTRAWLDKYTIMDDFATENATNGFVTFGVYGEQAKMLLADATGIQPPDSGRIAVQDADDREIILLRDTRLNGAGGFLAIVAVADAGAFADTLSALGAVEIDDDTYQTLRIEAGIPAHGTELTESYNPLEAGLTQYISFTKGCYIGQEVIARLDTYDKVQRHLVGILLERPLESAADVVVLDADQGKPVGTLTSVAYSPTIVGAVALAYIRTQYAIPGLPVTIADATDTTRQVSTGTITKLPFDL